MIFHIVVNYFVGPHVFCSGYFKLTGLRCPLPPPPPPPRGVCMCGGGGGGGGCQQGVRKLLEAMRFHNCHKLHPLCCARIHFISLPHARGITLASLETDYSM